MDRVEEGVSNFRAFQRDARDFFTEHRSIAAEQEKQRAARDEAIKEALAEVQQRQDRKLTFIGIAIAFLTLFCGALAAIAAWRQVKTGNMNFPALFSDATSAPVYADNQPNETCEVTKDCIRNVQFGIDCWHEKPCELVESAGIGGEPA